MLRLPALPRLQMETARVPERPWSNMQNECAPLNSLVLPNLTSYRACIERRILRGYSRQLDLPPVLKVEPCGSVSLRR